MEIICTGGDNVGIKTLTIVLHIISGLFALITSQIQTKRLLDSQKKWHLPFFPILIFGLTAAVFGTSSIYKKVNKILYKVK
jgi:hypothetical protein